MSVLMQPRGQISMYTGVTNGGTVGRGPLPMTSEGEGDPVTGR